MLIRGAKRKGTLLPVFILLLLFHHSFSQTTFQKMYRDGSDKFSRKVLHTSDGGYIYGGWSNSFTSSALSDCYVMKTNASGAIGWAKSYGEAGLNDFIGDIISTSDGGYAFTGTAQDPVTFMSKILFCKIDSVGNIQYQNSYSYNNTLERGYDIIQTNDGGYMIAADSRVNFQFYDILMIKLDAAGNVQWAKASDGTSLHYEQQPVLIHPTQDNGYVVIGSHTDSSASDYDPLVFKMDATGNEIWKYYYQGAVLDMIQAATFVPGQGYYLAGKNFVYNSISSNWNSLLMKIGMDGTLLWSKSYGDSVPYDEFLAIEYAGNDKLLISGKGDGDGSGLNYYYTGLLMDTSGTILWQRKYMGAILDASPNGSSVLAANDGGYLFAFPHGATASADFFIYSVKTDAAGNSGCFDFPETLQPNNYPLTTISYSGYHGISVSQAPLSWMINSGGNVTTLCEYIDSTLNVSTNKHLDTEVYVYPNPASEYIYIGSDYKSISQVQIINLLGEQIMSFNINDYRGQFSTSKLFDGIYFLKIYLSDKSVILKKIQVIH